ITRAATLCGYSPRMRLDLVLNLMAYQAVSAGKITVFGGHQWRPLLTVSDLVKAYLLLLTADPEYMAGQVFNIVKANYRITELAYIVCRALEKDAEIEVAGNLDARSYAISGERIRQALGFTPEQELDDAVIEVGKWLTENPGEDAAMPLY